MFSFRPHILEFGAIVPGHEAENGDYIGETIIYQGNMPCRAVSNGKATSIALEDGTSFTYQYVVYLNQNCREFEIGEQVRIRQGLRLIIDGRVQGFDRGQLNAKLWV
ncbi:MAG: hypothetical protein PHH23_01715 [Paludibacteraceae bacterium]|nr:hypothetical protein [Paludibacteraceae bacterium]